MTPFASLRRRFVPIVQSDLTRSFKTVAAAAKIYSGQPTFSSHPHIIKSGEATPGIPLSEYQQRRRKYADQMPPNSISLLLGSPTIYMSNDIPYRFRQQSDFYYLTGVREPDSALLIHKSASQETSTILFVQPKDPAREIWDGPRNGVDASKEMFGVDEVHPISDFAAGLQKVLDGSKCVYIDPAVSTQLDPSICDALANKELRDHRRMIQSMRIVKSDAEQKVMRRACSIAAKGFNQAMEYVKPGMNEGEVDAKLEFEFRRSGAQWHAYPPVVAGGSRANTLHYVRNDEILEDGTLLLVDAGCEYYGYSSDITRVWPVGRDFTFAQAQVYQAVYHVLQECTKLCVPSNNHQTNHALSTQIMTRTLIDLGLLKGTVEEHMQKQSYAKFYMHSIGHWLGMDVHDTPLVSIASKLLPGMIVTVEPGIYIPDDPSVPADMRGIGIRLENDVLVTNGQPDVLTEEAILHIDDVRAARTRAFA
eukprot:TRINITY_DN8287_c0_g1_i1.p1 TRINITY_DN8287_c0_g1~~TRINITY_DN8287_c0_g1_i1.p1  ORF type:complete len:478 (+),score=89.15 TRINITY_DN8287_c0_g1_i1:43-1476(+)